MNFGNERRGVRNAWAPVSRAVDWRVALSLVSRSEGAQA